MKVKKCSEADLFTLLQFSPQTVATTCAEAAHMHPAGPIDHNLDMRLCCARLGINFTTLAKDHRHISTEDYHITLSESTD